MCESLPKPTWSPDVTARTVTLCRLHLPADLIEDAAQEGWVAHLDGRNPNDAIEAFAEREGYPFEE